MYRCPAVRKTGSDKRGPSCGCGSPATLLSGDVFVPGKTHAALRCDAMRYRTMLCCHGWMSETARGRKEDQRVWADAGSTGQSV